MRIDTISKLEWFAQYSRLVLTLERGHTESQLAIFQKTYTTPLTAGRRDSRYGLGEWQNSYRKFMFCQPIENFD